MTKYIKIIAFFFSVNLLMIQFACSNNKNLPKQITKRISDKELREALFKAKNITYKDFYSKIAISFKNTKKEQSFSSTVKMKVDSAFSGTFKKGPVILGTYLIDKDSVKSTNKLEKCYFTEPLSYISSLIGVELEYDFFQSVIIGKPIGLNINKKYKQIKDKKKQYYILSSHNKRKFHKIEKEKLKTENERNDNIYMQYFFTPDSLNLAKIHIEIPADTVSIYVNYLEQKTINSVIVPELTTIAINSPKDSIILQLDYSKTKVNVPKNIQFSVPSNYENCNQ
ncbi:MAG TPA: DUF4292 domain-containing protein [Crocinitomix sp.]|nr:DUF4292 domain-containing protein [Crocinitomix sp.]